MASLPAAAALAGMIATPLVRRGGPTRRALSSVVVGGLFATTTAATARRWGRNRTAATVGTVAAGTWAVEQIGTRTGYPFGRYTYTGRLRPSVGDVPVLVPLAWLAMSVPARETVHAALGSRSNAIRRVGLGAVALTAWDLFLDPQMVGEGFWLWQHPGRYRGIPLGNYAGWLVTAAGVMAVLEVLLPPSDSADPVLVGEYGAMATLETIGFARFFGDRFVAAVGGSAMVPLAALAAARLIVRRRRG